MCQLNMPLAIIISDMLQFCYWQFRDVFENSWMHISNRTMFNWCQMFKKSHAQGLVCLSWTFWRFTWKFFSINFGLYFVYKLFVFLRKILFSYFYSIFFYFLGEFNAFHFVLNKTAWYNIQRMYTQIFIVSSFCRSKF